MGGLDLNTFGMALAAVTGIGSFFLGRHLRRRRAAKRQASERAAAEATQTRQVRRARQRSERK